MPAKVIKAQMLDVFEPDFALEIESALDPLFEGQKLSDMDGEISWSEEVGAEFAHLDIDPVDAELRRLCA